MVKAFKLHKFFALSSMFVVLILSITGFFLDHDRWNFLYTTTFSSYPQSLQNANQKLFTDYFINPENGALYVASKRGLFQSTDNGKHFHQLLDIQVNGLTYFQKKLYLATSNGLYVQNKTTFKPLFLQQKDITAISSAHDTILFVVDKTTPYLFKPKEFKLSKLKVQYNNKELHQNITLSRFVRDLHYGRGILDGDSSLFINDYGALFLIFLSISGIFIWIYIHKIKKAKQARAFIRYHANVLTVLSVIPVVILSITGIFLDHASDLNKFMKSIHIPNYLLPPVYRSLEHDIWSIDYDGKSIRIGNRYGVFKSDDKEHFTLESKGFGYSLSHINSTIYVGGMGSTNRIYTKGLWKTLPNTPHMFKRALYYNNQIIFFSSHTQILPIPSFQDVTLYSILLSLHDGSFFSSWWVWINDYAAVALLILFITGIYRWWKRKRYN